ncbi:MAG: DUF397 domain-containing protein [Streptomycetales bacterium]
MTRHDLTRAAWRKSSYSGSDNNCVEVAPLAGGRWAVRDSKDRRGPALVCTPAGWRAFVGAARSGAFDRR